MVPYSFVQSKVNSAEGGAKVATRRKYFIAHDYVQKWSEQNFVIEASTLHLHPYILNILPASSEIGVSGDILQGSWHTHRLNSQSGIVLCGSWQRRTINYNNWTTLNNIKLIPTLQKFETACNYKLLHIWVHYNCSSSILCSLANNKLTLKGQTSIYMAF